MTTTADAPARESGLAAVMVPDAAAPGGAAAGRTGPAADEAVTVLYHAHYAMLVRTAVLLVGDVATAEDVVQDCFIAMHRAWWRLRDPGKALPYLRRAVINRSRSVLRRRVVADRHLPLQAPQQPSAEDSALAGMERSSVPAALRALPARQREVVVLRPPAWPGASYSARALPSHRACRCRADEVATPAAAHYRGAITLASGSEPAASWALGRGGHPVACGEAASDAPAVPGRLCGAVAAPNPATDYAAVSVDEPGDALCKVAAILCTSQKKLGIITESDPYGSQC